MSSLFLNLIWTPVAQTGAQHHILSVYWYSLSYAMYIKKKWFVCSFRVFMFVIHTSLLPCGSRQHHSPSGFSLWPKCNSLTQQTQFHLHLSEMFYSETEKKKNSITVMKTTPKRLTYYTTEAILFCKTTRNVTNNNINNTDTLNETAESFFKCT